ncbi:hypothetical protein ACFLJF_004358 [Salmonella enterica]|nr:hypothetical protein [Salmonella enterica]ECC3884317.1 hypothetical protein [Salmonella enterica subsp. diarizonae]EBK5907913.1 hypothetical protein [Salmonella enterica]ECJ4781923.1 hypothetical protein [Salmonella enterica subsp. diarizonae]EDQ7409478.1 hypothetical protein [Salmonella enterica subsp. diarizonae]
MNHEKGLYFHDRDSLANAINVPAYYDLSAELIADEIFNNKENTYQVSATLADIIAERQRQIAGGFFTHGCDEGQLVSAAIAIGISVAAFGMVFFVMWQNPFRFIKPMFAMRVLVALVAYAWLLHFLSGTAK